MLRHPNRRMARTVTGEPGREWAFVDNGGTGVRVQFTHPLTGELIARVPAMVCSTCGDVVLAGVNLDKWHRCACCARDAREKRA